MAPQWSTPLKCDAFTRFPFVLILPRKDEVVRKAARVLNLVITAQAGIQARLSSRGRTSQRSLRLWVHLPREGRNDARDATFAVCLMLKTED